MGQDALAGIFSDRVPVPQKGVGYNLTALAHTPKFKRRGRDDIHRPKHTFVTSDFEYKKFPMCRLHEILV